MSRPALIALLLLWVTGCSQVEVPLVSTGLIQDLEHIPQDAQAFVIKGDAPILQRSALDAAEFEAYWFGPWSRETPQTCTSDEFAWAADYFPKNPVFGPNRLQIPREHLDRVLRNARVDQYPSRGQFAITIRNSALRALPSPDPVFFDFLKAGEGYPFDYNQNSAVWAGTPLFVSHQSQDGRFIGVESPYACGWIDSRDIAYVDKAFVSKYRSATLAAIVRDRVSLSSDQAGFLFQGRVGMLLPLLDADERTFRLLVPIADTARKASWTQVSLPRTAVAHAPLPFTEQQAANLVNEIVGQPYGWGGLGGYRDCSSTVLDLFLAFGLPLPRNSSRQAKAWKNIALEDLSPRAKRKRILSEGVPFRTLLNLSGHTMLYLGAFEGEPVAFHTIWGLRTASPDEASLGRHVIGKSVITTLSPGRELEQLSQAKGDLLARISSFTLLGER